MKLEFLSSGGGSSGRFDFRQWRGEPLPLDDASRVIRVGLIAAGFFFGLLLVFALVAPISGAASAVGEVTTGGGRITVQPVSGGVVRQVLAREGQAVRAGQPVVLLNGVRSTAAYQQAQAKRDALRALQARLIAERDGQSMVAFPPDLTRRAEEPAVAAARAAQSAIFQRRRARLGAERAIAREDLRAAEAQRTGAVKQRALIEDELVGIRSLYRRGYARLTQVRALERAAAELEAASGLGGAAVARANFALARVVDQQIMANASELGQIEADLAQVDPALRVVRLDAERDVLRAPVDGRVSGLARVGAGAVVPSGRTLMEIVPNGRPRIVEADIRPVDIDEVRVGSAGTLRCTTVNPRGRSSVDGTVVSLSPARVVEEGGRGAFRAQITVDDPAALRRGGVALQPGVPVTVQVKTKARTLFDYLFAPLGDVMSGAFREE